MDTNQNDKQQTEVLLTYSDLSKILKRSECSLRHDVSARQIPFIKIGRSVRFSMDAIRKHIEENSTEARGGK